jgi:hypothetical protein
VDVSVKPSTSNLRVELYVSTGGQFVVLSNKEAGEELSFHRTDWPTLKNLVETILKRNNADGRTIN